MLKVPVKKNIKNSKSLNTDNLGNLTSKNLTKDSAYLIDVFNIHTLKSVYLSIFEKIEEKKINEKEKNFICSQILDLNKSIKYEQNLLNAEVEDIFTYYDEFNTGKFCFIFYFYNKKVLFYFIF